MVDSRKTEKSLALIVAAAVVVMSAVLSPDFRSVGIYAGCSAVGRLVYPVWHVGIIHAALNAWCLLVVVFRYEVRWPRLLAAYAVAVSFPAGLLSAVDPALHNPSVGLSGVLYALFGMLAFDVARRWYWQKWMAAYLLIGLLMPHVSGLLHLYCYACGLLLSLLNYPVCEK